MPRYRSARQEKGRSAGQSVGMSPRATLFCRPEPQGEGSLATLGTTKRMGRQKEWDDKKKEVSRGDKEKSRWITLEA